MDSMKTLQDIIRSANQKAGIKLNGTEEERNTPEEYAKRQCEWLNKTAGNMNAVDGYDCEKCLNKGMIFFLSDDGEPTAAECSCMKTRRILRRAMESGLNDLLSEYTFVKFIVSEDWQKEIKDKAMLFCKDDDAKWFYIGGQSGAGKSHLCTAIAAYYIKNGKDVRYMLWRDDVVKLKQLSNNYDGYQAIMQPFKDVDVLYIDDMFKSQSGTEPTRSDLNIAFEILDARLRSKDKITIVSSEFMIRDAMMFDEATIGRIYQKCGIYKIDIPKGIEKNYRLKGK